MALLERRPLPVLVALGILTHLTVFIRLNPIAQGPSLALAVLTAPFLLFVARYNLTGLGKLDAAITTTIWYTSYMSGVLLSILFYRAFFHRLRHFPGPLFARLSQWNHVWHIKDKVNHYKRLDELHKQYGEFVRIGPNTLSIADPTIVGLAHAHSTKFEKTDWYNIGKPVTSLHQMTDHSVHDMRRKHGWDKAFTASALRSYDSRVVRYADKLVEQLSQRIDTAINVQEWVGYFAFDVMGDLAFGRSFDALDSGKSHWFIDHIRKGSRPLGLLGTVPWVLECIVRLPLPLSLNPIVQMIKHSSDLMEERKKITPDEEDVMSHILEAGKFFEDPQMEDMLLTGDARLLVIAGSDTTTATLTYILYHLARDPVIADNLRAELKAHNLHSDDIVTVAALTHLDYLNAVINETLRLHPPVPGGVYRDSPKGGITVDDHFVPEGCKVITPQYTIQRSPKAFVQPDEFIPERWTTRGELVLDKEAFFPFLLGRFGCIGKQLAYNEVRTVITKLVLQFDFAFAAGEDGTDLLEESQDHFTVGLAPLNLVLRARKA